jgi:probable HAF family extracellular repeat protein
LRQVYSTLVSGRRWPPIRPLNGIETVATGINNHGDIVGYFSDSATPAGTHGFVRWANGTFTIVDDPNSNSSPVSTIAYAISDTGTIVGEYSDAITIHGFLRKPDGAYETINGPGAVLSYCVDVNSADEVVCQYQVPEGVFFSTLGLIRYADGKTTTFGAPGAAAEGTFVGGICGYAGYPALSSEGEITGFYYDSDSVPHGYLRYPNGTITEFSAPGAGTGSYTGTVPASVNSLGTIVGSTQSGPPSFGDTFVRFAGDAIVPFNVPVAGQLGTNACAISSLDEFTGYWVDSNFVSHGFIAVALRW